MPIKLGDKFTIYPSYRYYNQTAADYFPAYEQHLSTSAFYTSDFDLSKYMASQFSFGFSNTDIFTKFHLWKFGHKSIDLKYTFYDRDNTLSAHMISRGAKFIMD